MMSDDDDDDFDTDRAHASTLRCHRSRHGTVVNEYLPLATLREAELSEFVAKFTFRDPARTAAAPASQPHGNA